MLFKVHKATRFAVAVCDSELIGKIFSEGQRQLDLTGKFFLGEEKNEEEVLDLLDFYNKEDACFNFIGKESCNVALKAGLIKKDCVALVQGIPFALVLL